MIAGAHVLMFAEDAEAARVFFRDVLDFDHVDTGHGWLIFALPPSELGIHPDDPKASGTHELFLMCHDVVETRKELEAEGVEFTAPIEDQGFGLVTRFRVPGAGELQIYQPKHKSPLGEFSSE